MLEDHLRSPLHEKALAAVATPIQRRHELVLRLERDHVDAWIGLALRLSVYPEFGGERKERAFGRIALDLPHPFRLNQLRVVAQCGDASHESERGIVGV